MAAPHVSPSLRIALNHWPINWWKLYCRILFLGMMTCVTNEQTDRRTDRQTPGWCFTLTATDVHPYLYGDQVLNTAWQAVIRTSARRKETVACRFHSHFETSQREPRELFLDGQPLPGICSPTKKHRCRCWNTCTSGWHTWITTTVKCN